MKAPLNASLSSPYYKALRKGTWTYADNIRQNTPIDKSITRMNAKVL